MRYVPGLIPDKSKVLPMYFKGSIYEPKQPNQIVIGLSWALGIYSFITALIYLSHPLISIVFACLGLLLIPLTSKWIENQFRFHLTTKIKSTSCALLLVISISLISHFNAIDRVEEQQTKLKIELADKQQAILDKQYKAHKDSISSFIKSSREQLKSHNTKAALKQLQFASQISIDSSDRDIVLKEKNEIYSFEAVNLTKEGKYKQAFPLLDSVISQNGGNAELLYYRALCYSKFGEYQFAVTDCKAAIKLGSADAETLYEKINPIKKHKVSSVTRCCDGSTSNATGRGACSHHGGVCDWDEPIYVESRQYE